MVDKGNIQRDINDGITYCADETPVLEFISRYAAQKKVVRQLNFFRALDSEKRNAASKDLEQMRVHAGNDI